MLKRSVLLPAAVAAAVALIMILLQPSSDAQVRRKDPVTVAQVERARNLTLDAALSHRPAYIPREFGRLVSVHQLDRQHYMMFFEAANGDITMVRLLQQGNYLFLDTYDQGGVATVLTRQP
jgi:hypothetical protein